VPRERNAQGPRLKPKALVVIAIACIVVMAGVAGMFMEPVGASTGCCVWSEKCDYPSLGCATQRDCTYGGLCCWSLSGC